MKLIHIFLLAVTALFSSASFAELVDIGNGRKMVLECEGSGSPTVVFISGRSDRGNIWKTPVKKSVFEFTAKITHACIYDRPGTVTINGDKVEPTKSTSVAQPITPKDAVSDLHELLIAAKLKGPFVLVAHSYGGLIARLYASTYPKDVAGLILVDTLTELLYDSLDSDQQKLWIRLNSNYSKDLDKYTVQERTDLVSSFDQLRNSYIPAGMLTIVLTSDQPYDFKSLVAQGILPEDAPIEFGSIVFKAHLKAQQKLAQKLSAKQVADTHAGHYVHTEQPQLVNEAIQDIITQIRSKERSNISK